MEGIIRVDARISAHEAVCAERWKAIRDELRGVKASLVGLFKLVLICAGTLIMGMAGLIVTLALRGHG